MRPASESVTCHPRLSTRKVDEIRIHPVPHGLVVGDAAAFLPPCAILSRLAPGRSCAREERQNLTGQVGLVDL